MTAALALATAPLLAVIAFGDLRHHRVRNRDLAALAAISAAAVGAATASSGAAVLARMALGSLLLPLLRVAPIPRDARLPAVPDECALSPTAL